MMYNVKNITNNQFVVACGIGNKAKKFVLTGNQVQTLELNEKELSFIKNKYKDILKVTVVNV